MDAQIWLQNLSHFTPIFLITCFIVLGLCVWAILSDTTVWMIATMEFIFILYCFFPATSIYAASIYNYTYMHKLHSFTPLHFYHLGFYASIGLLILTATFFLVWALFWGKELYHEKVWLWWLIIVLVYIQDLMLYIFAYTFCNLTNAGLQYCDSCHTITDCADSATLAGLRRGARLTSRAPSYAAAAAAATLTPEQRHND